MTRSRPDSPDAQHDVERANVVGIDPGLNRTGYAVVSRCDGKLVLHEAGVVRSTSGLSVTRGTITTFSSDGSPARIAVSLSSESCELPL